MPDLCLCKLVVSGPRQEVQRFGRHADPRRGSKLEWRGDGAPGPFSFQRLMPIPEDQEADDIYGTPWHEPDEVTKDRLERITPSLSRVSYGFVTAWAEPHPLVRHVSRTYPTLDFILGAVAPAVDEVNCWYFRGGRGRNWMMGSRAIERIRLESYRSAGVDPDDAELWDDVEADHALMAAVVAHWTTTRMRAVRGRAGTRTGARRALARRA